jgi:hypothetical protein
MDGLSNLLLNKGIKEDNQDAKTFFFGCTPE